MRDRLKRLRDWWHSLHMMTCPVCSELVSFRHKDQDLPASRMAHRQRHGVEVWRAALAADNGRPDERR